ncbi:hypothetical protein GCM10023189_32940 [Nibrella saemangeumensis]|uniref:JAB domain-containing protein n=1 Tax=Nibrella saemangeumensis TaxID=1084526 RepID=A0ABP8N0S0_9BACT
MLFSSADGSQCLLLTEEATSSIRACAREWYPLETGGILVGTYDENYRVATVYLASGPPSDSQHSLYQFIRGTNGISELLERAHQLPTPRYYLGEWHTHPAASPKASLTDKKQMNAFADCRLYGASSPVLLIVGGKPPHALQWQASVYQKNRPAQNLWPL